MEAMDLQAPGLFRRRRRGAAFRPRRGAPEHRATAAQPGYRAIRARPPGSCSFDRSRSQIAWTLAGVALLEHARDVLARLEAAEREVVRIGEGMAGRLRIAFVGSATFGVLPEVIRPFVPLSRRRTCAFGHEQCRLEARGYPARDRHRDRAPLPRRRGIESEPLHHVPLIFALPDPSPLLEPQPIRLRRSSRAETFALYPRKPRPSFADQILGICRDEGFMPKSPVMAQDYQTAISLVSVGVGMSLVPDRSPNRSDQASPIGPIWAVTRELAFAELSPR